MTAYIFLLVSHGLLLHGTCSLHISRFKCSVMVVRGQCKRMGEFIKVRTLRECCSIFSSIHAVRFVSFFTTSSSGTFDPGSRFNNANQCKVTTQLYARPFEAFQHTNKMQPLYAHTHAYIGKSSLSCTIVACHRKKKAKTPNSS